MATISKWLFLRAAADLPEVPAGRVAGASCSPGCRVLDSVQEAADTPLHDPVLQPAHACNKITHTGTSLIIINILCNSGMFLSWQCCSTCAMTCLPCVKETHRRHHTALDLPCGAAGV